jgi:hypothetical protein
MAAACVPDFFALETLDRRTTRIRANGDDDLIRLGDYGRAGTERKLVPPAPGTLIGRGSGRLEYEKAPVGPGLSRADRLAFTTY